MALENAKGSQTGCCFRPCNSTFPEKQKQKIKRELVQYLDDRYNKTVVNAQGYCIGEKN